jgi:hypothetical protein
MEDMKSVSKHEEVLAVDSLSDEAATETPATPKMNKKQKKSVARQERQLKQLYARAKTEQERSRRKVRNSVAFLKSVLGAEDFNNLKDICSYNIPEQKGPDGSIVQAAKKGVNYRALIVEGNLVIAMNRESRILSGKRKRTTGRASKRKSHRSTVNYANMRSQVTLATEEVK